MKSILLVAVRGRNESCTLGKQMLASRIRMFVACCIGCVLAGLISLGLEPTGFHALVVLLAASFLPTVFCYRAGLRNLSQLAKLAGCAGVSWALTFALRPQVSSADGLQAPQYWLVACCVVSFLLAFVCVAFIPKEHLAASPTIQED